MTGLEDQLRDELSQLAAVAQPETVHPLRDPAPRRRTPAARFLAAAAAVAAVAAVAIAVAVIAPGLGRRSAAPVPAAPALVRSDAVPRFYVLTYQRYVDGGHKIATYAALHSSATGATLARISLRTLFYQGGAYSPSITAAANDRTFVVMESNQTSVNDIVWLFRLQLSSTGRSVRVRRLPVHVPRTVAIDDVALSPDGTRLASCWLSRAAAIRHTRRSTDCQPASRLTAHRIQRLRARRPRYPGRQDRRHLRGDPIRALVHPRRRGADRGTERTRRPLGAKAV